MNNKIVLEVCVDSFTSAVNAFNGGADRLEVCSNLYEGGTTPSLGLTEKIMEAINIPVNILIRPRAGNFVYSEDEIDLMLREIKIFKNLGVNGFVVGCLTRDSFLDYEQLNKLVDIIQPFDITFHKAFDFIDDQLAAINELSKNSIKRILTSGNADNVNDGLDQISVLSKYAQGKISIMPGGGVTIKNISSIINKCNVTEIHGSFSDYVGLLDTNTSNREKSSIYHRETNVELVRKIKSFLSDIN